MGAFDMKWQGGQIPVRETLITPLAMVSASQYVDKIDFTRMVNEHVKWDPSQCNLSPGMLAKSVVLSTFDKKRAALYHIPEAFAGMDLQGLFGLACWEKHFTDDAIARTLDKLYVANTNALYSKLSLSCWPSLIFPSKVCTAIRHPFRLLVRMKPVPRKTMRV